MSKTALAVKETQAVAELPDFLQASMLEDAGLGLSQQQEDNTVPLIYLLQANSPATKKSNPAYVEGASAGDIWKRNSVHRELVPGDEGFLFQPCFFEKVWIEWRPNRGGLAGIHKEKPVDAKEESVMVEGRERKVWMRENGNTVVETRQHVGLAEGEPYVISLSSTGHSVSRQWMQQMNQHMVPGTTDKAASFSRKYRLTTVERSKDGNSWFIFKVTDAGWVSPEEYMQGRNLHKAFDSGIKKAADVEQFEHDGESNEEDAPPF